MIPDCDFSVIHKIAIEVDIASFADIDIFSITKINRRFDPNIGFPAEDLFDETKSRFQIIRTGRIECNHFSFWHFHDSQSFYNYLKNNFPEFILSLIVVIFLTLVTKIFITSLQNNSPSARPVYLTGVPDRG